MEQGSAARSNGEESKKSTSSWLSALVEVALMQRRTSSGLEVGELVQGLGTRLGVRVELVKALVAGCDAVVEYAMAELDDEGDSLTEEDGALAASRGAFRPLLEVRLQEQVRRIDGAHEPVPRADTDGVSSGRGIVR
jgi:hypothetical protein